MTERTVIRFDSIHIILIDWAIKQVDAGNFMRAYKLNVIAMNRMIACHNSVCFGALFACLSTRIDNFKSVDIYTVVILRFHFQVQCNF